MRDEHNLIFFQTSYSLIARKFWDFIASTSGKIACEVTALAEKISSELGKQEYRGRENIGR